MILNNLCIFFTPSYLGWNQGTLCYSNFVILTSMFGHLLSAYIDIIANYTIPCIQFPTM